MGLRPTPPGPLLLTVSLERCITLGPLAFPCGPGPVSPMAATLAAYGAGRCASYAGSPLEAFFDRWQPSTLAEVAGIEGPDVSDALRAPSAGRIPPLPWDPSVGSTANVRLGQEGFRAAAARAGIPSDELAGIIYHGPVSDGFGRATFDRLVTIYDSIRQDGYRPGDTGRPHLVGQILVREDDHRVLIRGGKHRVAGLSALGYRHVPVAIGPRPPATVERSEATSWHHVTNGTFSAGQAEMIFDRLFEGRQPAGLTGDGKDRAA